MTKTCVATFETPDRARAAVKQLIGAGITPRSIDVMTSHPIHGEAFLQTERTRLPMWAVGGGVLGFLLGASLSTFTALNYPLVKGGMPIVSPWTAGLITYETTMIGVVLATFAGLLVELRLPNLRQRPYASSVVDGAIVVAVACDDGNREAVEKTVNAAGASTVTSWPDRDRAN